MITPVIGCRKRSRGSPEAGAVRWWEAGTGYGGCDFGSPRKKIPTPQSKIGQLARGETLLIGVYAQRLALVGDCANVVLQSGVADASVADTVTPRWSKIDLNCEERSRYLDLA